MIIISLVWKKSGLFIWSLNEINYFHSDFFPVKTLNMNLGQSNSIKLNY